MKKVCVLLSSYNGEQYIKSQIDSILAQKDVEIYLKIRDDGSTDKTVDIIKQYNDKRIHLEVSHNVGCARSFLSLLQCGVAADYYAFSDQDDVWEPEKLIKGINLIKDLEEPALAICNMMICDSALNPIQLMSTKEQLDNSLYSMERDYLCNVHGCRFLWNRKLHNLLVRKIPAFPCMHDIWVNSVANSVGVVKMSYEPLIYYRVHQTNLCGYNSSILARLKKGIRLYLQNSIRMDILAQDILSTYDDVIRKETNGYNTLLCVANYSKSLRGKIKLIQTPMIKEARASYRMFRIFCILINKY